MKIRAIVALSAIGFLLASCRERGRGVSEFDRAITSIDKSSRGSMHKENESSLPIVSYRNVSVDGLNIAYREAGITGRPRSYYSTAFRLRLISIEI